MKNKKRSLKYLLTPDYMFDTFDLVSVDFLRSIGVSALLIDIDNTLAPYEQPEPDERIINWFAALSAAGISASLISNNHPPRVELFNKELGLPAYYKAHKPFKKNLLRAMADMGTSREETILMGDQVFTDVWAAHNAKIRAILVPPINDKKDLFTKFKRLLERPILRKYEKRNKK